MMHGNHSNRRPATNADDGGARDASPGSFVAILTLLVRRRRLLVGLPLGVFVFAIVLSLVMQKEFTAQSRFAPETDAAVSGEMAGLAAQFGLAASLGGSEESLDFYGLLLRSHELMTEAILTDYVVPIDEGADTLRGTLIELLEIDGDTPEDRLKAAKQVLEEQHIGVSPYRAANVLVLRISAPWPELAEAVNRRMLTLVNEFNLERRQSRAAQEREFLAARLEQVQGELRRAEDELQRFVSSNRRYAESPETALEYQRLQRQVTLVEQRYGSVAQGLEQAQVDAVRNTPVITVLDRPEGTAIKTAPDPVTNGLLGLVLGGGLAIALVLGAELLRGARKSHPEDYSELRTALGEVVAVLPWRRRSRERARPVGSGDRSAEPALPVAAGIEREER